MHKQKTKGGAKKRLKINGEGKIMRKKAYKSHLLGHKSKRQKRNLGKKVEVNSTNRKVALQALGIK